MGLPLSATGGAALDALFARTTGKIRPGLERTRELLARMGDPQQSFRSIHVAGTNGKGSVSAMLESVLRYQGFKVGMFTSPHLVDFRERFIVDGRAISEAEVEAFLDRWMPDVEELGATFFETTTALAFHTFSRERVDIAVVETGLGGRLDSTNVLLPIAAGVTTIGMEHAEWLGSTIAEIAREKAGIFKAGVPAVIGEPDPAVATVLRSEAERHGAAPIREARAWLSPELQRVDWAGTHVRMHPASSSTSSGLGARESGSHSRVGSHPVVTVPLPGAHQADNLATALTLLDCAGDGYLPDAAEWNAALAATRLPGRFQRHGKWIFDVAHNPQGAGALAETVKAVAVSRPLVLLMAVLADKDWRGMLDALAPLADEVVLTDTPSAPEGRRWVLADANEYCRSRGWPVQAIADLDAALEFAGERGAAVLVTGSFHTVGDAMLRLQVSPLPG